MAEHLDVVHPSEAPVLERLPMRDEDGEIRREFIEAITRAIKARDTTFLRAEVGSVSLEKMSRQLDS